MNNFLDDSTVVMSVGINDIMDKSRETKPCSSMGGGVTSIRGLRIAGPIRTDNINPHSDTRDGETFTAGWMEARGVGVGEREPLNSSIPVSLCYRLSVSPRVSSALNSSRRVRRTMAIMWRTHSEDGMRANSKPESFHLFFDRPMHSVFGHYPANILLG